ncbi:DUF937 domain-containing protein [Methylobacterium sp. J-068]|uniref:DUF937 domain-containing protein n=1 Tax=Methylobacterium sp. J-068 TaxID=2836649 RepID=UPI001FBA73BF|nr:DUF937 domain-containing protein [Methylobacterium sp. J-068]MCJ2032906.1 DUF937 domain-containing protein [Methylobacterium sp. J-068]
MFNLFDILQAQAGAHVPSFARQFGLTQEQSLRAMEALLPALTMGLQRNAANDPTGFAHLFNLVGANPPSAPAQSPQMEMLVKQLFGSSNLSQAVLQQAATVSGVATPALKQMLPIMAGMVVAGIVHVMINQNPPPAPAPRNASQPFGFPPNAWSEMMDVFLRSGGNALPSAPSAPQARKASPPRLAVASKAAPAAQDKAAGDAPFEMMNQMFQTGLEVHQENARAMQRLFDTFWQDPRGSAGTEANGTDAPNAGAPGSRTDADRGRR